VKEDNLMQLRCNANKTNAGKFVLWQMVITMASAYH
jgi:hypothetical protein